MSSFHSPVLLPSKFLEQSTGQLPHGVTDHAAYDELITNYATLKGKVNNVLVANVDKIRHDSLVDLTRNYIGAMGLQAITSLLLKNDNLRELRLPGSGLNNDSVVFFCRAMTKHTRLAKLDLSCNDISLAAGLALLSLLQQNRNIVHVNLSDTQVPHPVMKKIKRCLENNNNSAVATRAVTATMCETTTTTTAACDAQHERPATSPAFSSTRRETVRRAEWVRQEEEAAVRLAAVMRSELSGDKRVFIPSPHLDSGWRLLEVTVLAPPYLFVSEMEMLASSVFPRLNKELVSRKVHLLSLHDPPDGPAGANLKHLRFAIAADVLRNVEKSRVLTIELMGDRAGDYEQLSANELLRRPQLLNSLKRSNSATSDILHADSEEAPPLRPIMQIAHERAMMVSNWVIFAARLNTRKLGVPPSLTPLLTEEPRLEHPDYLQPQVWRTVTVNSNAVCGSQKIQYDAAVKEKKWREHRLFCENVLNTAPVQELVIRNYKASFDHCTKDGQIHFKDLEEFAEAVYQRMRLILFTLFPLCNDGHPAQFQGPNINAFARHKLNLYLERMYTFLRFCVDCALIKKNITNRLGLYVIAPPSRNAFLLHGREPAAVSSLIGAFTMGLFSEKFKKYRIAFHTMRSPLLSDEPTGLREMLCNIILQLCPDHDIYRQAIAQVDDFGLQKLFADILSGNIKIFDSSTKGTDGTSEQPIIVVVIDGMDAALPSVAPCAALRVCEKTGKDIWGTPPPQDGKKFSHIPFCLSRNVRLVLSCMSDSEMQKHFESRGRDSTELFSLGPITPNDFDEMLGLSVLSRLGVEVSDDDFMIIRKKEEALSTEYLTFVVDTLRSFNESPGVETQAVMKSLPGTVTEMVLWVCNNARKCFGVLHVRTLLRLLISSRWGIYESQLRIMLRLSQQRFNQLLRMMRPLLEYRTPSELGVEGGNALFVRISIRSGEVYKMVAYEDLQDEGSEGDKAVWHNMLVDSYFNILHDVIRSEVTAPIFGLKSTSPYERMAIKELPYHVVHAGAWHILFRYVLSLPFLMIVYRNSLGYHLLRELVFAFNTLYELYELGEYPYEDGTVGGKKPSSLLRLRQYIYFLRQYNARLTEFPHLVLQTAVEDSATYNFVVGDAREFITRNMSYDAPFVQRRVVFFVISDNFKSNIHCRPITTCRFDPKGRRITTGSVDRSVCSVNAETGIVIAQARHAPTAVEELFYCETGAYHAVVCHDRTILIYDSAHMNLVSRCDGGLFNAPLAYVAFSARGRFYMVATEDLHLRVFDTEKSSLLMHVDQRQFMPENVDIKNINIIRGFTSLIPHKIEDEVFYATCHNILTVWQLVPTRDKFLEEACFELPFTVSSGRAVVVAAGTHLLLHPAPPPPPEDGRRPPPRLLRICSLETQREVAVMNSTCSQTFFELSANENLLASGLEDGSVAVHKIPWAQLKYQEEGDVIVVPPIIELKAYSEFPVPTVKALRFRGDNRGLFALGNRCHIKYWVLPRHVADYNCENNINFATADVNKVESGITNENYGTEKNVVEGEKEEYEELFEGIADGEFVFDSADVTSWDVVQVAEQKGAEIIVGDSSGRLTMLRLWSPLM